MAAKRWYAPRMPNVGPLEIAILLIIALLVFGPKRLPEMGRSLGRGMREFKESITGKDRDDDRHENDRLELQVGQDDQPVRTQSRERDTVS